MRSLRFRPLVSQRVDRIEVRRTHCRIDPRDQAGGHRHSFLATAYSGYAIAEALFLAECGLQPTTILEAMTQNAAVLLGQGEDLGTLEAGKLADLIVVEGDPLEDLGALWEVELVVQGDEVVFSRAW